MSKQSLAVKYRPKTFDDVVEQDAIKIILLNELDTKTFKHAYLFTGPAGCGKTTAARIFANEINQGRGNPIEIDAASNNGVDNVRDIIDNAKRKSLDSEYKIYIVDECHMLSTGAWNAMLKLLEEPPVSTIFIMCTTDPQKIPATILSRVQRYDFSKIATAKIVDRLKYIVNAEATEVCEAAGNDFAQDGSEDWMIPDATTEALEYIAKLSEGGMRDAITMLDKCLSLNLNVKLEDVAKTLGTVDYDIHFQLMYALNMSQAANAVEVIEKVYNDGKDIKQFIKQFMFFMVDVCKFKMFQHSFEYIGIPNIDDYGQRMMDEDSSECLAALEWLRQLNADIKWESNAKMIIEASIIIYCGR